jgi:hypothetical protein
MAVEHRQKGEGDPGRSGRGTDTPRHLADIIIGLTVFVMMQIVEFADRGEAGLQHFAIDQRRHRLDMVGGEIIVEGIHDLAPGPETVLARPAPFRQSGHAALEGMGVDIGHAGHGNAETRRLGTGRCLGADAGDTAAGIDRDLDIAGPAAGQQYLGEVKFRHGRASRLDRLKPAI